MDEQRQTAHSAIPILDPSSSPLTSLSSRPPSRTRSVSPPASESEGPEISDDGDEDDWPPPRKRSKVCPSSAGIGASVRATVVRKAGGKCWLCGMYGVHVAHVFDRSERILFSEYRSSGLLHMDSPNELQNLMFLCAGCHHGFHSRVPIWAFLPVDLDGFVVQEKAFHQARAHSASLGVPLCRPNPWNGKSSLQYGRYQIQPDYLPDAKFLAQPIKRWHGNPVVAILRSAGVIAGIPRLDPLTKGGLPEDVAHKLQELLLLYGVPPPPVKRLARTLEPVGCNAPPEVSPPSLGMRHDHNTRATPRTDLPPHESKHWDTTRHVARKKDVKHPQGGRRKRGRHDEMPRWVIGPDMTSNMLISWSMGALEIEAEEEAHRARSQLGGGV